MTYGCKLTNLTYAFIVEIRRIDNYKLINRFMCCRIAINQFRLRNTCFLRQPSHYRKKLNLSVLLLSTFADLLKTIRKIDETDLIEMRDDYWRLYWIAISLSIVCLLSLRIVIYFTNLYPIGRGVLRNSLFENYFYFSLLCRTLIW